MRPAFSPFRFTRLSGAHERAHEFALDERRDRVHVDALAGEELARVVDLVDARRLDADRLKSGGGELDVVVVFIERARDAARPRAERRGESLRDCSAGDDVGHSEAPARLQDPKRLAQDAILVGREIDDAVRDDHVDRIVGQRDMFDFALEELDVGRAGLALVIARERQHVVGHVEAVRLARRADPARRQQHIDAAARTKIENGLALSEFGESCWIAATERSQHGFFRQRLGFVVSVEIGRDPAGPRLTVVTARRTGSPNAARNFGVASAHDFLDIVLRHGASPHGQAQVISSGRIALLRVQHSAKRNPTISCSAWVLAV